MDVNILIQKLKSMRSQIMDSYCIVNGELIPFTEIQNMGYDEFSLRARRCMPSKLYKYFPNRVDNGNGKAKKSINYSMQALKDNTVFMQSPSLYDDIFGSDITLDFGEYQKFRLLNYCQRCGLHVSSTMSFEILKSLFRQTINNSIQLTKNFDFIFKQPPASKIEKLSNEYFLLRLKIALAKHIDLDEAIIHIITEDFNQYSVNLKTIFRTTCFATTPYSQLMWGGTYADCHKGFCAEYTILPNNPQYQHLFHNLFPMIYCKIRSNITERLVQFEDKEPTEESLWDIYFHGVLRKSIDWAFQNEWRLLLPLGPNRQKQEYCIPFFPITKIFLGNQMLPDAQKEIIEICQERNIPYVSMKKNPHIFEMEECSIEQ